jgi:dihydrofolate reductase/thymidylate synthase
MLSRFNIIVAVDDKNGIGKNGTIPWRNQEDFIHFKTTTIGNGKNAVIMGRKTYESLPPKFKPLSNRKNIVITTQSISGVDTYKSLFNALEACSSLYEQVFIIGGQQLYKEAIKRYLYLCDKILVSHIEGNYDCDVFFPYADLNYCHIREIISKEMFSLETITVKYIHPEQQYLDLLNKILNEGDQRLDRTKVGTKSIFAPRMEFDLRDGFPLLTTKQTWFDGIKKELLFFISGKTDTKILESQGVKIWKANTTAEYLIKYNLPWREGDMGPGYPHQWRHAGAEYTGCDIDYTGQGVDQLQEVINSIKKDPFGRRHIISSWDVANIKLMALPPCHCLCQFYVGCNGIGIPTYLDCCLYQRSSDMFLGVPFNIASYALLMSIIGHLTGLIPRKFIHDLGDAHIYLNHIEQVKTQVGRVPYPFPKLKFNRQLTNIDDIQPNDIILENYKSYPKLVGEMAV